MGAFDGLEPHYEWDVQPTVPRHPLKNILWSTFIFILNQSLLRETINIKSYIIKVTYMYFIKYLQIIFLTSPEVWSPQAARKQLPDVLRWQPVRAEER